MRFTRKTIVLVALVGGLFVAGVATAAWLGTGAGSGSAKATSFQDLTVSGGTATAELYPGASNQHLFLHIVNPNPFAVTVTAVNNGAGSITADGGHASCTTTGVTFTNQTGLSISVPANGSTDTSVNGVSMDNTSSTGCQGATFTVPVTVDATS